MKRLEGLFLTRKAIVDCEIILHGVGIFDKNKYFSPPNPLKGAFIFYMSD
jgi:hypothetical protein